MRYRKRQRYIDPLIRIGVPTVIVVAVIVLLAVLISKASGKKHSADAPSPNITIEKSAASEDNEPAEEKEEIRQIYTAEETPSTAALPSDVVSTYGILIDLADDSILEERNARERISPASMTKILTVLVAAEHLNENDLDNTMKITLEFTDYSYSNDLSAVGFAENEEVTVRDLLYGTILPSGGDAAIALATYVAGSEEAFVEMMNEKLEQMQLSDSTHFTNVAGMYNEQHYSTVYDMAMILYAAINNPLCRDILNARTYTTSSTPEHPDGIQVSNWFLRRIEDKDCGLTVECAKTGFVVQSRNCAASFADDSDGHGYICVTADSTSGWRCIYDHVAIYSSLSELSSMPPLTQDTPAEEEDILLNEGDEIPLEEDILPDAETGDEPSGDTAPETAPSDDQGSGSSSGSSSGITVINTVTNGD